MGKDGAWTHVGRRRGIAGCGEKAWHHLLLKTYNAGERGDEGNPAKR